MYVLVVSQASTVSQRSSDSSQRDTTPGSSAPSSQEYQGVDEAQGQWPLAEQTTRHRHRSAPVDRLFNEGKQLKRSLYHTLQLSCTLLHDFEENQLLHFGIPVSKFNLFHFVLDIHYCPVIPDILSVVGEFIYIYVYMCCR